MPSFGNRRRRHGSSSSIVMLVFVCMLAVPVAIGAWQLIKYVSDYFDRYSMYDKFIQEAALRNGVDPRLVKAVIWRESRFRRDALGLKGEIGLMQIMPAYAVTDWARHYDVPVPCRGVLFNPELNIEIGSWYLGKALARWKNYKDAIPLALCEYNAGLKRAEAWKPLNPEDGMRERISISSTSSYVTSIVSKYDDYRKDWDVKIPGGKDK